MVQLDPAGKNIYLAFTAHEKAEGAKQILHVLTKNDIQASFFFTGAFLRNPDQKALIQRIVAEGHYVGPHSDGHLLYCEWDKRDALLVDRQTFEEDLRKNYAELEKLGVTSSRARWFMPPYEWYNKAVVDWARAMGLSVVSFTPGVRTNADYTTPEMANYMSSDEIVRSVFRFEKEQPQGLNGCIVLIHPGTNPTRKDKLYDRLPDIIERLKQRKYQFKCF